MLQYFSGYLAVPALESLLHEGVSIVGYGPASPMGVGVGCATNNLPGFEVDVRELHLVPFPVYAVRRNAIISSQAIGRRRAQEFIKEGASFEFGASVFLR